MTNDQFVQSFIERCKIAMALREESWDLLNDRYNLSIRDAVAQVFGDDPMGHIAFLAIYSHSEVRILPSALIKKEYRMSNNDIQVHTIESNPRFFQHPHANNGVYILETITTTGSKEYRVAELANIDALDWDDSSQMYWHHPSIRIANARKAFATCDAYDRVYADYVANVIFENIDMEGRPCKHGIKTIVIDRIF